ncbi:hypothetical protein [Solirubrobacter soli]|uniref:hypothetical protein n=1 Tax=Solirubrobacter soli TaxID=363832 RepID=UPI0004216A05|nr:hypothetical protein [Solirubrobacter soli]
MRKSSKLILAAGAIAALAVPSVASANTTATFHATQPSGGGGNWDHTYTVDVNADGTFTGTNVITGLDNGQTATVNETVSGTLADGDHDGYADHVTLTANRGSGFYTFQWGVNDAPMDGVADNMDAGTTSYAWAKDWQGSALPITFTAPSARLFAVSDSTDYKNHGQYVKSQGGGKDAAQSSIGMPEQSQKNKK